MPTTSSRQNDTLRLRSGQDVSQLTPQQRQANVAFTHVVCPVCTVLAAMAHAGSCFSLRKTKSACWALEALMDVFSLVDECRVAVSLRITRQWRMYMASWDRTRSTITSTGYQSSSMVHESLETLRARFSKHENEYCTYEVPVLACEGVAVVGQLEGSRLVLRTWKPGPGKVN